VKIDTSLFNNKKTILLDSIYKNVFLDKKKINKNPRFISLRKVHKPIIKEIHNESLLAETISQFI
jgi:3-dehydroquinate synthetase